MRSTTAIALLAALPSIYAISLSDFQPHLQDLPSACNSVYTAQVAGCKNTDFTAGLGCSTACIAGLQAMLPGIQLACSSADVFSSTNVLNSFLTSDGVRKLCPNAPAATATPIMTTSTSTTQAPTSTQAPTTAVAATTDSSTSSTSTSTSSTSSTSSSTDAAITPASTLSSSSTSSRSQTTASSAAQSSAPIFIYSTSAAASAPSSTSATAAQATQGSNNSGGGSPFDTTSIAAGISAGSAYSFALFLSALLAAYVL